MVLAIVSQSFYNNYNRTHKLSIDNNEYGQLSNMVSSNIGVARISVEPVARNKC